MEFVCVNMHTTNLNSICFWLSLHAISRIRHRRRSCSGLDILPLLALVEAEVERGFSAATQALANQVIHPFQKVLLNYLFDKFSIPCFS